MIKYTVEWHDKAERWDVVRWTETVEASELDLPTIWAKVEEWSKVNR